MGLPIARNLARAGVHVRAWNRTVEKAEPLREDGAAVFESPEEAAAQARIVLTMLADADAVIDSARAALPAARDDAVWLQMSTIGESGTDRCAELASEQRVEFVDAPVLGTKLPAEEAKLVIMASGPRQVREPLRPIFDAIGQKTMWIGEAGSGTRLKMVTNSWVLTVTEGAAETIALAQGLGVDPALLFEALEGGTLDLPYLRMKGEAIIEHDFEPMFRLALAAKDAGLVGESARRHHLDLPLFDAIRRQMNAAAKEHGDKDMSATYFASAPAGVDR